MGQLVADAERAQHVAGFERRRGAGRARRHRDVLERHEERLALDERERDVQVAGQPVLERAVDVGLGEPPEIIKEYFDGLSKVESAKHPPNSGKSFIELSSLTEYLPHLLGAYKVMKKSGGTLGCLICPDCPDCSDCPNCSDCHGKSDDCDKEDEKVASDFRDSGDIVFSVAKMCDPSSKSTENKEDKQSSENDSTHEPEKKSQRPVYQDGGLDLREAFGTNAAFAAGGQGGIADMMKMFAPMMEGLMGGINNFGSQKDMNKKDTDQKDAGEKDTKVKDTDGKDADEKDKDQKDKDEKDADKKDASQKE